MQKQEANTSRVSQFQRQRTAALLNELLVRIQCVAENQAPEQDPEAVHQLRVATRRMQAALTFDKKSIFSAEPYLSEMHSVRRELKRIMTLAGEVRNRDITAAFVNQKKARDVLPQAAYIGKLAVTREKWRRKLAKSLRDSLDDGPLVRWRAQLVIAHTSPAQYPLADQRDDDAPLLRRASKILCKATQSYFQRGNEVAREVSPASAWHKFRLAAKRLRYSLEFFQPGWDLSKFSAAVREVQQHLGVINDGATIRELLGETAISKKELRKYAATLSSEEKAHVKELLRFRRKGWVNKKRREWQREISKTLARGSTVPDLS